MALKVTFHGTEIPMPASSWYIVPVEDRFRYTMEKLLHLNEVKGISEIQTLGQFLVETGVKEDGNGNP